MLMAAGFQVPVKLFVEDAGNVGAVAPWQMVNVVPKANCGVTLGVTVTVSVVVVAHCPLAGVNVYVPEAVLLTTAGLQVPVTLLADVPGSTGAVAPAQMLTAVPKANCGVTLGVTVTVSVVVVAHCPAEGVNV